MRTVSTPDAIRICDTCGQMAWSARCETCDLVMRGPGRQAGYWISLRVRQARQSQAVILSAFVALAMVGAGILAWAWGIECAVGILASR